MFTQTSEGVLDQYIRGLDWDYGYASNYAKRWVEISKVYSVVG